MEVDVSRAILHRLTRALFYKTLIIIQTRSWSKESLENASIHEEQEPPRSVVDHPSRRNVKRVDKVVEPKWDRLQKNFFF